MLHFSKEQTEHLLSLVDSRIDDLAEGINSAHDEDVAAYNYEILEMGVLKGILQQNLSEHIKEAHELRLKRQGT